MRKGFWALTILVILSGCEQPYPEFEGNPADLKWVEYSNREVGYRVGYPAAFKAAEINPGEVALIGNGVHARIVHVTEEEGRSRGLWVDEEPQGETILSGLPARRYVYHHWDGPSYIRTISYVIEKDGKFLALEFRTPGELTPLQKQILESFQIG